MTTLETLFAEREIYRALVGIARAMDDRDWLALERYTTGGITAELGTGFLEGREALVKAIRAFLDDCGPTQHLLGNVVIEVDGETATSRAYVSDMHLGTGDGTGLTFCTLGDYHDQWVHLDGRWQISHRQKLSQGYYGSLEALGPGPEDWR